ncbi:oligosaccharide flippase family protein [Flavobacteriaceae bacterium]|nr:oligosaccharide flippase family protein [Flavobacteriaceae bacterium]
MKSFLKLLFSFTTISFLNKAIPLITVPILTNNLGLADYGRYVFALALIAFFDTLINFGFKTTAVNELILCDDIKQESFLFFKIISLKGLMLLISLFIIFIYNLFFPLEDSEILIYGIPFLFGYVLNQEWFFHGKKQMLFIMVLTFVVRVGYLIAIVSMISTPDDLNLALLISSLSFFVLSFLGTTYAISKYNLIFVTFPKLKDIYNQLLQNIFFFLATLSVYFYSSFNFILLGNFYDIKSVGIYAIADKVIKAVNELSTPFNNAIYPRLSSLYKENPNLYVKNKKQFSYLLFFIFLTTSILIVFNSEHVISFFISDLTQLDLGIYLLIILSISTPFNSLNAFYTIIYVINQKQRLLFQVTAFASVISIITLSLIGHYFEIIYFAIGFVLMQLLTFSILRKEIVIHTNYSKKT